jgi:type II secretory pathway pseudopilin PulG
MRLDRQPRANGFSLVEVIAAIVLVVSVAASLGLAFVSSLRGWSMGSATRELAAAGQFALNRMLLDVREAVELRQLGADVLQLATQFVEDSDSGVELVTWNRTAGGQLTRQVDSQPPVLYASGVITLALRGPRLWCTLDAAAAITTPRLGPAGAVAGGPIFSGGMFGQAVEVAAAGQSLTFPATLIDPLRGTIELWADLTDAGAGTRLRCLLDTTVAATLQRLQWTCSSPTGRMVVTWAGATVIDWTPAPLLRRFRHLALVWDAAGLPTDRAATLALYQDGRRVAAYAGALAANPFEGTLYVGSGNDPASGPLGLHAQLPLDNLIVHGTAKTGLGGAANENDLGLVEVGLGLSGGGLTLQLEGGAQVASGRLWP